MSKHRSILSTWNVWYKSRLIGQYDCWSLRCSWNIACRCCSSYIFILDLAPGFNGLGKDNCKTKRLSFNYCDMVRIIFEILPNKNSDIITPKQNTARPWAYFMGWAAICGKLMWWFDSHCYIFWIHLCIYMSPGLHNKPIDCIDEMILDQTEAIVSCWCVIEWMQGPVLLTLLRHVARILANGRAAFFESCDAIGWNSCDVSQKR